MSKNQKTDKKKKDTHAMKDSKKAQRTETQTVKDSKKAREPETQTVKDSKKAQEPETQAVKDSKKVQEPETQTVKDSKQAPEPEPETQTVKDSKQAPETETQAVKDSKQAQEKEHQDVKDLKHDMPQGDDSPQHSGEVPPKKAAEEVPSTDESNPEYIVYDGKKVQLTALLHEYQSLSTDKQKHDKLTRKAVKRYKREMELRPYQAELIQMQNYLREQQKRMIIIFEGRDAAGKGGTIRRVTRYMNERHYRVVAMGKPTVEEESQWYYQKYVAQFPRGGEIVLFDRSWYTRAMVERVFGFCTEQEYKNFMRGVDGFEKDLVRQGTILVKLYFSVTKKEQARRFKRRQSDPLRQWKLSKVDLQAQDRWDEFTSVKYDMLKKTGTTIAPWIIIRSNNKHKARLNTMKVILNAVPYERLDPELDFVPDQNIVVSGARELERLERERLKKGKKLHQTIV